MQLFIVVMVHFCTLLCIVYFSILLHIVIMVYCTVLYIVTHCSTFCIIVSHCILYCIVSHCSLYLIVYCSGLCPIAHCNTWLGVLYRQWFLFHIELFTIEIYILALQSNGTMQSTILSIAYNIVSHCIKQQYCSIPLGTEHCINMVQ